MGHLCIMPLGAQQLSYATVLLLQNPCPNDDEVFKLCEQCKDAGNPKKDLDIKDWFNDKRKLWKIGQGQKVNGNYL